MGRVQDKVIMVTGGARGIGRAVCRILASEGARVAVVDLLDDEGRALVDEIAAQGGDAGYFHLDVSDEDQVEAAIAGVIKMFGPPDVLVNNAGIGGANKPTHLVTEDEWDKVMAVNVKGPFFCTKHIIPVMRANGGGSIVNLSSIYGIVGAADAPAYHASKGAIRLMTKTDALMYAADHIRVNSVHPGVILTPMVEDGLRELDGDVDQMLVALTALHPVGRLGTPEDVAWGIVYLASDESAFVTGSELVIDGGYTAQ